MLTDQVKSNQLQIENAFVTKDNIDQLLSIQAARLGEISVLSIDVDGNDYWIWESIESVRPRVVVMEYNATWHPPMSMTIRYQETFKWKGTNYYGASLTALELLARHKGYSLVGCCFAVLPA